jgi:hypothetical protein
MTPKVNQSPDGAWTWEILDEDGDTYLRSEKCFGDYGIAERDLERSSHLVWCHLQYR